jgi:CheY-like chemotaxis protein
VNEHAADNLDFVHAGPDETTPARFPRLASLPPDLAHAIESKTERSASGVNMQFDEIIELLKANNESVEGMRRGLLDEGGTLDRMAKSTDQKLSTLLSHVTNEIGTLRDLITVDRLHADRDSATDIKLDLPVSVLVVDDDPVVCRAIQTVLGDYGVTAHIASDSEDALSILRGELPIDLVLVDLRMPRNGKGLAATILAEHSRVSVIVMSGNEGKAASAALELKAHGAIGKPFHSNDALALLVKQAAEHRRLRVHGSRPTP